MKTKAIFFDRDGTINYDPGYISDPVDFRLLENAGEALRLVNASEYYAFVVSNQSGIGRGLITETQLARVHEHLQHLLEPYGAYIDGIYFCPHHPDDACQCRKPRIGLIEQINAAYPHINLDKSYVVGDKNADIQLACNIGCKAVLVLTGEGMNARTALETEPAFIAEDILQAVEWIIADK